MNLKIITVPNPLLRQKSKPVARIDKKIIQLANMMIQTVKQGPEGEVVGVGLSAVQVGKPVALFVAVISDQKEYEVFINPEIILNADKLTEFIHEGKNKLEGCLSIPGIYSQVKRYPWIKLKYQNLEGKWQEKKFEGFTSVVIQHEYDHTEGILFVDRVLKQKGKLYRLEKDGKGENLIEINDW